MSQSARIAINGFGRIGRQTFRVLTEKYPHLEVVAINDLTDNKTLAHLLEYDSTYGKYPESVEVMGDDTLKVGNKEIKILSERNPADLPWGEMNIDIVLECTGVFRSREQMQMHIDAGCKKVILSAPAKDEIDGTFVLGVNEENYDAAVHNLIANASCTTNCLAPVVKVLHNAFGIKRGLMTTIHSYTNDQKLLDLPHSDLRRARATMASIIPTTTGAAKAVTQVIPELKGKLNGMAFRVPTPTGSVVDFVVDLEKDVTKEEVNQALRSAAEGELKGILDYNEKPLVSVDYHQDPHSSIVDGLSTDVMDNNMVKVIAWYDNEWGYSNRYADLCDYVAQKGI